MGGLFNLIGRFVAGLWRSAMFWRVSPLEGVRTGSSLAGCLMFLFLIFCVIGALLMMLGFDLAEIDLWLDAQGGWMDFAGRILFRGLVWLVFLFCVLCLAVFVYALFANRESLGNPLGALGLFLFIAFIAWMCSASLFAPLY